MALVWKYFALGFSALLPVVNPLGSALVFLGLVGVVPAEVYRSLARRIAINTVLFFAVIELIGSTILHFFGISLPIVQVSGGLVLAAMGWSLLNQKDPQPTVEETNAEVPSAVQRRKNTLEEGTFYPLTFPVTAGPGCIVVMLTLGAHASTKTISDNVLAHVGLLLAVIVLSALIYLCYAYAPQITRKISPSTAHGILRVVAFILLCIGVQIAWNGAATLLATVLQHR
ncbi:MULTISPECIES: MarC family protein [Acidobacteriaceae]|uniref:MarC family protein n=1 Tax=Acidobacteriaceae TaxID=204434 RepID=UPI00131AF31E|nr:MULTISPECIES: MarC family protein [Acidobacteriaceae]MDW5267338.1 MarC family protein [Edaphobacter sp.]